MNERQQERRQERRQRARAALAAADQKDAFKALVAFHQANDAETVLADLDLIAQLERENAMLWGTLARIQRQSEHRQQVDTGTLDYIERLERFCRYVRTQVDIDSAPGRLGRNLQAALEGLASSLEALDES